MSPKVLLAALSTTLVVACSPASALAGPVTYTFTDSGEHAFIVPAGVPFVHVVAVGAGGSYAPISGSSTSPGGWPGKVSGNIAIGTRRTVFATVNTGGGASINDIFGLAGGNGGGASDLRTCSVSWMSCLGANDSLSSRLLVAGGGGGAGAGSSDSAGGSAGAPGGAQVGGASAGQAGRADAAGAGGASLPAGAVGGASGDFGVGGSILPDRTNVQSGGGAGGGGWFGGGAGGSVRVAHDGTHFAGGGGGGGSNYVAANVGSPTSTLATSKSPSVEISFDDSVAPAPTVDAPPALVAGRSTISGTAGHDTGDSTTVTVSVALRVSPAMTRRFDTTRGEDGRWSVVVDGLASGIYDVTASQGDAGGNTGVSAPVGLTVDADSPAAGIDSPSDAAWVTSDAILVDGHYGTAPGDGRAAVTVSIGDRRIQWSSPTSGGTGTFSLDAGHLLGNPTQGEWTVDVLQTDAVGNETHSVSRFRVDQSGPTAQITAPADGAAYTVGDDVRAAFSCDDNVGIQSCDGPVAAGERIDTATAGQHSFSVTAVDEAGNSTTREVTYTVRVADTHGGDPGTSPGSSPGAAGSTPGDSPSGGDSTPSGGGVSTPGGSGSTPGGSGNPAPGPDPTSPRGQAPVKASPLRFGKVGVRKGRLLTIGLSNPNAATLTGTLKVASGRTVVGAAKVKVGAKGRATVSVTLNAAGRRALAKKRRLRVTIVVVAGGVTSKRVVTLRAPVVRK